MSIADRTKAVRPGAAAEAGRLAESGRALPGGTGGMALTAAMALAASMALSVIWTPAPLSAQGGQELETATFELRLHDRRVGTESFSIRQDRQTVRAVGRVAADTVTDLVLPLEAWLESDENLRPSVFRTRYAAGPGESITGVRENARFRIQVTSPAGERVREFLAPPELAVLEPGLATHWAMFFRQHPAPGDAGWRVPVLVPSHRERGDLRLRSRATEPLDVAGERVEAIRMTFELRDEEIHVWRNEEGRLVRIARPAHAWTATWRPDLEN